MHTEIAMKITNYFIFCRVEFKSLWMECDIQCFVWHSR